jgi:hypothetical protein
MHSWGLDFTLKSFSKEALERNRELRILWEVNFAQYTNPDLFRCKAYTVHEDIHKDVVLLLYMTK